MRYFAAVALGQIGNASAVPVLIEALEDEDVKVRRHAAGILGRIKDASAVPALIEVLKDEGVRQNAADALGRIGDASAVPALIETLKDKNALVRLNAARALGYIAENADLSKYKGVTEGLGTLWRDKDGYVRLEAAQALRRIAKRNPDKVAPYMEELKNVHR